MKKTALLFILLLMPLLINGCNLVSSESDTTSTEYGTYFEIENTDKNIEEISEIVFANYLESLKDINVEDARRIKDYQIEKINIEKHEEAKFVFSVEYSLLPATANYVVAGNGIPEADGWVRKIFKFVEVEISNKGYKITNISTSP